MAMINYPECGNFILCHLANKYNSDIMKRNSIQARSYYNNIGTPSGPYYPAFDPISVLASLAFLAFLIQSFATLFDRSRSILPTVMSARESTEKINDIENQVANAFENYANLERRLTEKEEKRKVS